MTAKPFTVLVIGGGIGGLALGQALVRAGVNVEIYERNQDTRSWESGYRLNVNQTGSRSLYHCLPRPLWEAFVATSVDSGAGLAFRTEHLEDLATIGRAVMTGGATGPASQHYAVSRPVLRTLLLAGMDGIVRYGRAFQRYERQADGKVTAFFADGSTATGDVLVGADGANSLVRQQYLPGAPRLETDAVAVAGRLPLNPVTLAWLPDPIATGMNCVLPPTGSFLFTSAFDGKRRMSGAIRRGHDLAAAGLDPDVLLDEVSDYVLWAFITHRRHYPANSSALDGAELKLLVDRMIRDWHPALRRVVADTDPATVGTLRFKRSTTGYGWTTTPVTLIGDAVHNMPPVMGLGANIALRDAAELSAALAAAHRGDIGLVPAIAQYETRMREYGFGAVREATRYTGLAISGNRLARHGMRGWLRLCQALPPAKRKTFGPVQWDIADRHQHQADAPGVHM
jgi:2-polyprenyl-6-methoxyphenol hydroxylase-like FAD-dependent oxidoreductase